MRISKYHSKSICDGCSFHLVNEAAKLAGLANLCLFLTELGLKPQPTLDVVLSSQTPALGSGFLHACA